MHCGRREAEESVQKLNSFTNLKSKYVRETMEENVQKLNCWTDLMINMCGKP